MRNWADLPDDLLSVILSNLFGKDRQRFSLVCKSWNRAALVTQHDQSPWLMFYQRSTREWKFFQYNWFLSMEFPKVHDAEILCSKYGWLLMSHEKDDLFLFNPFNGQSFGVPPPKESYETFCFFHPPTSSDCIIVGFAGVFDVFGGPPSVHICVLKLGEDEWKYYEYNCKKLFISSLCTPILHRGLLYFLDVEGNVGIFNIKGHPNWTIHTNCLSPARLRNKLQHHFLIKLDGEEEALLAVFVTGDEKRVSVYKLLEPNLKWNLVKDLCDKTMFVSRVASFMVTAPVKSMANTIYFAKLYGDSNIFYSLNTQKYHSFDGDYSNRKYHGIRELSLAAWVMPSCNVD